MTGRNLAETVRHSGGVKVQHGDRGRVAQLEKPSSSRREIGGSKVGRITGDPGKSVEDERVAVGFAVATKRGNARGAKGPCCS